MKTIQKLSAVAAMLCIGVVTTEAATFNMAAQKTGNWNDQNLRTANNYQIGFSRQRPRKQAAYFQFDITPAGGTVTGANILIIGTTDYHTSADWPGHTGNHWLKCGQAARKTSGTGSISQITSQTGVSGLYSNQCTQGGNKNGGYEWVDNGLHVGERFDCFHYEDVGSSPRRIQPAVNANGAFIMWSRSMFDDGNDGQNYIWGSSAFTNKHQLRITTR